MTCRPEPRLRAYRRGLWAEALCRMLLRVKGYRILATRLQTPAGEIDILARRGRTVAVVEVKARPSFAMAAEALSHRQRVRLAAAARCLPMMQPALSSCMIRFDLMLVVPWRWPRHLPNAFDGTGR